MAETCSIEEIKYPNTKRIKFTFNTDSAGAMDSVSIGTTSEYYTGRIQQVATYPQSSASASWDCYVYDASSMDLLAANGKSRANTNSTWELSIGSLGFCTVTKLRLKVEKYGGSKAGVVCVWVS
jgi:hypothetical protein